jgi:UDP-glucose:O-linked fucose beta-1,3-glucosyltransferase
LKTHSDFDYIGAWGIWSILNKLSDRSQNSSWILIAEPYTNVDWSKLVDLTNNLDPNEDHFLGRALDDDEPTIIHHYYGFQGSEKRLFYPDFAAGVLLSRGALKRQVLPLFKI